MANYNEEDRAARGLGAPPVPGPPYTRKAYLPGTRGHRDPKTGRYARRPVPDVDAESKFGPTYSKR